MRPGLIKKILMIFAVALLIEMTVCQFSFWSTLTKKWEDVTQKAEKVYHYVAMEEMESLSGGKEDTYVDDSGYLHVPEGAMLLRLVDLNSDVNRIHLDVDIPEGYLVKVTVFAQDEGNTYLYQLGEGRVLLRGVTENNWLKIYPYGEVKNLYLRLETADFDGNAAAGRMGELVCNVNGVFLNGRMPFRIQLLRVFVIAALLGLCSLFREKSAFVHMPFISENRIGTRKRKLVLLVFTAALVLIAFYFVRVNPACQKNLALHHAQYQELARSLSEGRVDVGEGDIRLREVNNPYDTINLQANQIPYLADYAYYEGKYYVYFGIVPELMLYLPYYLLTGRDLPNYWAVYVYFAGFIAASSWLVYELMKRYFPKAPFFLHGIGVLMLCGSYSYFYLLIRPDLYHVPIAASLMFASAGIASYMAGLNRGRKRNLLFAAGSLCMALTAGCRPQFLVFLFPALLFVGAELCREKKEQGVQKPMGAVLGGRRGMKMCACLALPYMMVAAAVMYYNMIRFGSPFDFGATYSMTSNDMTHRGFNVERILYGIWYFLFQLPRLEANFPYLRSAEIATDYLGKMVSESCFGGIFACSMLVWPVFGMRILQKESSQKGLWVFSAGTAAAALIICMADATGAGILQRYSADISFGLFLAAFPVLLRICKWAKEKKIYRAFLIWIRAAVLLHLAFLALILVNTDSSVNLLRGNPELFYKLCALMRW